MQNTSSPTQPPLAVVGLSALFPKAANAEEFWSNIRRGVDSITEVPDTHWNPDDYFDENQKSPDMTYARRGGFLSPVPFDPLEFGISPNNLEAIDTSQLLGLVGAKRALEHAGYGAGRQFDRSRVGCILGVTGTLEMVIPLGARLGHPRWRKALKDAGVPDDVAEDVVNRISESYVPWQENSFPGLLGNVVAGRIANRLDLHGTNCVVDAACASSLSAIHLAALELWTGRSDMVVTGGIDTFNDIFMFMCFSKTPALSPAGDAKPFSEDADGTILGEGVGMLVLKRLDDAERDGDRIYAVIKGIGTSSDGAGNAVYAPKADGQIRCLLDAYRVAGVTPDTIELVEAHGTGTKVGDATEVSGLMQVFSAHRHLRDEQTHKLAACATTAAWCAVGSIKSQIGHTKAAAGAAGVIKAILALQHRVLPPTIKVKQPPAALLAEDSPFYVNTEARPWLKPHGHRRRAAVSAFGFGGSNFHCVLEESPQRFDEPEWDGDVQVVALSAESTTHLVSQLHAWAEPREWSSVRSGAVSSRASFRVEHPHRLLLVVERDKTDVAKLVAGALTMLERYADRASWSTPDGAHYGRGVRSGKLGVLFPGQGAQYVGMLRELACQFPAMNDVLAEANEVFAESVGWAKSSRPTISDGEELVGREDLAHPTRLSDLIYPTTAYSQAARERCEAELRATQIAQPAIGAVSLGALTVLQQFGIRPEAAAGHSYGELTALCASKRFQPAALYRLSMLRGRLMAEAQDVDGGMLAIGAPLTQVEAAIKEMAVDLVVANYNSPNQVVLSGRIPEIDRASELFARRNMRGKKLPVAAAFHSPLVAPASRAFRPELEEIEFAPSAMPVYANSTATEYPADPRAARDLLATQLARPVNFVREVEQMYADGVRTFLEVGPGGVLTGLVNSILSGRDFKAVALDSSNGKRRGMFDLACALAPLSASGHSIHWESWDPHGGGTTEAGSPSRLRIPICGANYVKPRAPLPPRVPMALPPMVSGPGEGNGHGGDTGEPSAVLGNGSPTPACASGNGRDEACGAPAMLPVVEPTPPASAPPPIVPAPVLSRVAMPIDAPSVSHAESPSPWNAEGLAAIQDNLRTLQRMQEETARLHQRFLESQEAALRMFEELARRRLDLALQNGRTSSPFVDAFDSHAPVVEAVPAWTPAPQIAEARSEMPAIVGPVPSAASVPSLAPQPLPLAPPPGPALRSPSSALTSTVLSVVSEKTGYPTEMLNLEMSLDHDLGIDSIKRVEILSALQERVPNLPAFKPEELGSLHTLQDVVALAEARSGELGTGSKMPAIAEPVPSAASSPSLAPQPSPLSPPPRSELRAPSSALTSTVLAVVSEKTGYPTEMLNLEMSLDHDLGIDSIKRVEILSALQERVPNLPAFKPEELGSLHTLQDVVALAEARSGELGTGSEMPAIAKPIPPAASTPPLAPQPLPLAPPPGPALRAPSSALTSTVLAVVSEKTGYPTEMLNLTMSLDHDLGIDSIKRVEILSALQERVPNLPAFKSEELGSLHTLQDVVALAEERSGELGTQSDMPAAASSPSLAPQPLPLAPSSSSALEPLTRSIVRPVAVPSCEARPTLKLARGSEVWITEDGLELSLRIAAELSQRGFKPRVVNLDEPFLPAVPDRLGGLIVVAPADGINSRQLWRAVEWLQKAGPGLKRAASGGAAVFATVSRLDGRFGCEARRSLTDPISGGLAGLTKSAAREWPEVACKAFDVADGWPSPSEAAAALVDEFLRSGPVEIGLSQQGRCTLETVEESLSGLESGPPPVPPGELVIVSGGARGVTAEVALAMARAWRPRLAILGRSPEPVAEPEWLARLTNDGEIKQALIARAPAGTVPRAIDAQYKQVVSGREVATALARLRATAVPLTYHAVDVRDLASVRPLVSQLQRDFGPVRGLIHGAGVLADQRIEDKTREQFDRVYETKVAGLRHLLGAVSADDLRVLGLFSSYTARYGRVGQCDYAIANEVLNKLGRQFAVEHPRTHVVSFNWGPWDGGMVTSGLKPLFAAEGVGLIPLAEGANLFVREFAQSASRPVEVLVLGETEARMPFGAGDVSPPVLGELSRAEPGDSRPPLRTAIATPSTENGSGSSIEPARVSRSEPAYQPESSNVLLAGPSPSSRPNGRPPAPGPSSSWVFAEIGQASTPELADMKPAFETTLNLEQCPFLESHVIGGKAVLPVAMIVEWLAHGAIHRNPGLELHGFDDLRVFQGVRLDRQSSLPLRVLAGKSVRAEGKFLARVQLVGVVGGREIVHAAGHAVLSPGYPAVPDATLRVAPQGYPLDMATAYATRLFHGPQLQGIAAVEACSSDGIVVDSRTASAPWAWMKEPLRSVWIADPLALDAALQAIILWCQELCGLPCLPCSIAKYRQYRKTFPRDGVRIVARIAQSTAHAIRADIEFVDRAGQLVAKMEGCESVADASLVTAFQRNRLD